MNINDNINTLNKQNIFGYETKTRNNINNSKINFKSLDLNHLNNSNNINLNDLSYSTTKNSETLKRAGSDLIN